MRGAMSELNMKLAARTAVAQLKALERIEDDYGTLTGEEPTFKDDEISRALAKGDIGTIAKALPSIMANVLGADEQAEGQ